LARVKKIFSVKKKLSAKNFFAESKKNTLGEEFFTESKPAGSRRRNFK
jgi:hypothetical protein